MDRFEAQRAIATLHSFRFFGLVFILPGVVGPNLPATSPTSPPTGDFATGFWPCLALLTVRVRPLFWLFVVAFNLVGAVDLILDYYHAIQSVFLRWRGSWALPTRSRSSTCQCTDDHAHRGVLFAKCILSQRHSELAGEGSRIELGIRTLAPGFHRRLSHMKASRSVGFPENHG